MMTLTMMLFLLHQLFCLYHFCYFSRKDPIYFQPQSCLLQVVFCYYCLKTGSVQSYAAVSLFARTLPRHPQLYSDLSDSNAVGCVWQDPRWL